MDDDAMLEKVLVKFSLATRPQKVNVTNWVSGKGVVVDVYQDTTFTEFLIGAGKLLGMTDCRVYALEPPNCTWNGRILIDQDNFKNYTSNSCASNIYIHANVSPTGSPGQKDDQIIAPSTSSKCSDRSGQGDFRERVHRRDEKKCVFCGSTKEPLFAAHIVENMHRDNIDLVNRYELTGINDSVNGITLCFNCHDVFDNGLATVDPSTGKLVATEALLAHEPEKWSSLNGSAVTITSERHWPYKSLWQYRFDEMKRKVADRKAMKETYPYFCSLCNLAIKSIPGLTSHRNSQKCLQRVGKRSSYMTPVKRDANDSDDDA